MTEAAKPSGLIDLHTHTTASDGTLAPGDLVRSAYEHGIRYLAIADHDTTNGLDEARDAASRLLDLTLLPAVELSGTSANGGPFHLLGYGIDPTSKPLQTRLDDFRLDRERRVVRIVELLRDAGVEITLDEVERKAGGGAISRAHIGRVLVDNGQVETIGEAFSRWLSRKRPAFVPREPLFSAEAVRLVSEAGGIAVLAHPLTMGDYRRQLPELIEAGLTGIEVYYGPYSDDERMTLAELARRNNLITTGGSDFHGPDHREGRELGDAGVPEHVLDDLQRLLPDHF
jgi:3',5'-nucleoside bisphosphate phosphatase